MLSYVNGTVIYTNGRSVTVEVNDHAYYMGVIDPQQYTVGDKCRIYVHKMMSVSIEGRVQEDAYAFKNGEEKMIFLDLLGVSGVGPKTAMSILRCVDINAFKILVANGAVKELSDIPGISSSIARRIVDEIPEHMYGNYQDMNVTVMKDVIDSLKVLGYSDRQISLGIQTIQRPDSTAEDICCEVISNISLIGTKDKKEER